MIKPLGSRVVVQRLNSSKDMIGSIVIPGAAKEKPNEGEVIAVGAGRRFGDSVVPVDVKVGNRILFGKYAGTDVKLNGVELLIVKEEEILGVIHGKT